MAGPSFLTTALSFPILLALGILVRVPALWHPVEEGQRNAQTACLTAHMVEDGCFRLDPIAPWRGDLKARLTQEFPLYNALVLALNRLSGGNLDLMGRTVSLAFWVVSFLLSLQHASRPSIATATALVAVAFWGLGIKFPSFVHLGLFLTLVLVDRLSWRGLFHPVLLLGGCLILASLLAWSRWMETVNSTYFPYWTGRENLMGFIMPERSRLSGSFWIPLVAYNFSLIVPLLALPWMAVGLVKAWKDRSDFSSRVWLYLLTSLGVSWLVWGKGPAAQSYYNLPNLVCFSAFFGLGMAWMNSLPMAASLKMKKWGAVAGAFLLFAWGAAGAFYLSQPDTP
ncbi:hypothetical protein EBX31_13580, partial [bacterium]|nr:hypothetical protein [bacterium]